MLIERQSSQQKRMVLIALIVVINAMVGYLAYRNFAPRRRPATTSAGVVTITPPQVSENIATIETLAQEFDRALLDREEFKMLEKYGSWPVGEATTGRANPFLPTFGP
jgi:hypothetical protein